MKFSIDNLPNDINVLKQIIVDFQRENLHWQEKYLSPLEVNPAVVALFEDKTIEVSEGKKSASPQPIKTAILPITTGA